MRIVHISDLYICEKDSDDPAAIVMIENLRKCIAHFNALEPAPDLLLVTGNITSNGSIESAMHARELLDTLDFPYKLVCGPNDDRRTTLTVFDHACGNEVGGVVSYMVEGFALRLIGLDSLGHNGTGGHICQKRLNWVNDRLAENMTQPTAIFMHHPPMKTGIAKIDEDGFNNAEYFGQLVAHYSHIKAIFCGHINFACHTGWNETVVSSAPGMGINPMLDDEGVADTPAYNLHRFTEYGDVISRTIYLS
jgi:3',5'-cyclic AMP phosphodiesterase CpdA